MMPSGAHAPRPVPRWLRVWPLYPALAFLVGLFLYPVSFLVWLSFVDGEGALSAAHYTRLFTVPVYAQVLLITLKTAAWTTVFALLAGYPVAYLLATVRHSTRNTLIILVLMPFWTSFLVRTFAWIVLLGRNGAVNGLLQALGITDAPVTLIYNFTGVMIGMVHALMPLAVLTMLPVMESIDPDLRKAAATLGARGGQTFWRIYFPLSLPGVAAGGLLVFITALGFFITPALLGGARETMIVQIIIFQIQEVLNWGFAGAVAMLLLVSALVIFYFYDRLLGISTLTGTTTRSRAATSRNLIGRCGRAVGGAVAAALAALCTKAGELYDALLPRRADRPRRGWSGTVLWAAGLAVIGFLALPAFFVVPVSFTEEAFLNWPPKGFSWRWYELYFSSALWQEATIRSLVVAPATGVLAMLLGVPAAFLLARQRIFARTAVLAFIISPIIFPHIIVAVGLFYLYSRLGLVGSNTGLILGHTVFAIPYVVVTVMAVLKNYDERLDQAAWTLGAGRLRTLWHITFPLIRAGLIAAFMFAFIISFDELTVALFVTGGAVSTLPKRMWDDALLQVSPTLAAVATVLLLFMSCVIVVSEMLRRRSAAAR